MGFDEELVDFRRRGVACSEACCWPTLWDAKQRRVRFEIPLGSKKGGIQRWEAIARCAGCPFEI